MNLYLSIKKSITIVLLAIVFLFIIVSCNSEKELHISASNLSGIDLTDAVIELNDSSFISKIDELFGRNFQVFCNKEEIAFQIVDNNTDSIIDEIIILTNFNSNETKKIVFKPASGERKQFPKRTQAELSIRNDGDWKEVDQPDGTKKMVHQGTTFKNVDEFKVPLFLSDHSNYIRYEGPGWESDKIGYRFYLDWRNATDIFGKKTSEMVLQKVGQDGFESYHAELDWGMDILKVGGSLGIGTFGYWDGANAKRVGLTDSVFCKIAENGILQSKILTTYYGWRDADITTDLISEMTINAGSRLTHQKLILSDTINNICTGIVKLDSTETISSQPENSNWAYFATYGKQSLNNDSLGMVIFYKKADLVEITNNAESWVIVLKPQNNRIEYYFGAAWDKEPDGIKNKAMFLEYLNNTLEVLEKPITIKY